VAGTVLPRASCDAASSSTDHISIVTTDGTFMCGLK
jgi:hypothetical protein